MGVKDIVSGLLAPTESQESPAESSETSKADRNPAPSVPEEEIVLVAELFHILSDPSRLRLILALAQEPMCVGELSRVVGLGQSATSHALRKLRDRGIARAMREGQMVRYHLADERLRDLMITGWEHAVGEQVPSALRPEPRFTGEIQLPSPKKKKKKDKGKKKKKAN